MKNCVVAGAIIAALLASAPARADDWVSFRDPSGAFAVDFPSPPKLVSLTKPGSLPAISYEPSVDYEAVAVMVIVTDYSQSNAPLNLDELARSKITTGRILKSDVAIHLDGQDGRSLLVTDIQSGRALSNQMFVVGRHTYQAITVLPAEPTAAQLAVAQRFNASLHFAIQ